MDGRKGRHMGRNSDEGGEGKTRRGPRILVGLGLLFVAVIVLEWRLLDALRPAENLTVHFLFAFLFSGLPALGISYGGYWLARSDVETDQHPRIVRWCVGGLVVFLSLNLVMIALWPAESLQNNVGWVRGAAVYGSVVGLAIGLIEARAIRRARVAEREIVRSEQAETQRQWLSYLNSLLRHEVLNTANVIEGYSDLLLDDDPDELAADRLRVIRRQSRNLTGIINDVQVLLEATEDADRFEVVNLVDVLTARLVELRTRDADVEIETTLPDDAFVAADHLLPRVFSNLLNNAVDHNDSPNPHVAVSVETTETTVAVVIADDGPGIPESKRDTLFEGDTHTSNHGLGLYLVRTLAERYGGTVDLRETGADGSVFAVELPRVRDPSTAHSESEGSTGPAATPVRVR